MFKSEKDSNVAVSKLANFPMGNKFNEFFPTTSYMRNDGSEKVQMNFIIESENRLTALKRDMTIMKFLRIGYIVNKSPVLTHHPQLEKDIATAFTEHLESALDEGGVSKFIPDMEIGSKKIVHVLREGDKKTGVMETQALEVRCVCSTQLKKLFFNAGLQEGKFGKFVPYELIRNDQAIVKGLIQEHNK